LHCIWIFRKVEAIKRPRVPIMKQQLLDVTQNFFK
jgi:hypothetical protein